MAKWCLAVVLLFGIAHCELAEAESAARDAKLIQRAKQIPVSQLDPALPPVTFDKWIAVEAGAGAEFHWEVNDCSEQTGTEADRGRDFPMCVEVDAAMTDKRRIVVSVAVGTFKKGWSGKPVVRFAQLDTPSKTIDIKQLSDLPAALIQTHGAVKVEVAK